MRSRLMIGAGVLLLVSHIGLAQTAAKPQPQAPVAPGRRCHRSAPSISGFVAPTPTLILHSYERYRDLRNGAESLFPLNKETESYFLDARAFNVGYRDQRYKLGVPSAQAEFPVSVGFDSYELQRTHRVALDGGRQRGVDP